MVYCYAFLKPVLVEKTMQKKERGGKQRSPVFQGQEEIRYDRG